MTVGAGRHVAVRGGGLLDVDLLPGQLPAAGAQTAQDSNQQQEGLPARL